MHATRQQGSDAGGRRLAVTVLAASTLIFAAAGVLASRLVPAQYEAATELAVPAVSAADAMLLDAARAADIPTDAISRLPNGIVLRQRAATPQDAERAVGTAADRVEARIESARAQAVRNEPTQPEVHPLPVIAAPVAAADPAPALAELRNAARAARSDLEAATKALNDVRSEAAAEPDDARERSTGAEAALASRENALATLRQERARAASEEVTPAEMRTLGRTDGRDELVQLLGERAEARERVETLSRTLLDGHPRMAAARSRLASLNEFVAARRSALLRNLDQRIETAQRRVNDARSARSDAEAAAVRQEARNAEIAELTRARDLAREVSLRLEATIEAAAPSTATVDPVTVEPAPREPAIDPLPVAAVERAPEPVWELVRTVLPTEVRHADPLPVAAASGLFGFGLAGLGLALRRRSVSPGTAMPSREVEDDLEAEVTPTVPADPDGLDITPIDDVIDGAVSSGITRIVLAGEAPRSGARPLAVSIARRLSLRGRAVALVDLSSSQTASRTMGVGASAPTLIDLIKGRASFAAVAARDFATRAEIVPGGATDRLVGAGERRNVLDFAEKSYELIVVDCTGLDPSATAVLMDPDAALLLAVDGLPHEAIRDRMTGLEKAGLVDMILVRERAAD